MLDAIDGDLIDRLATEPLLLGDVLFAICKPQADQRSVDDEAFAEGSACDSIDEAFKAVVDALVADFPKQKRRLMEKAAEKKRQIETRGLAAVEKHLDDPNLESQVLNQLQRKLSEPLTSGD